MDNIDHDVMRWYLIGGIVLLGILFWLGRAFLLWYWKVDEQIELLKEIRDRLPEAQKPDEPDKIPKP